MVLIYIISAVAFYDLRILLQKKLLLLDCCFDYIYASRMIYAHVGWCRCKYLILTCILCRHQIIIDIDGVLYHYFSVFAHYEQHVIIRSEILEMEMASMRLFSHFGFILHNIITISIVPCKFTYVRRNTQACQSMKDRKTRMLRGKNAATGNHTWFIRKSVWVKMKSVARCR